MKGDFKVQNAECEVQNRDADRTLHFALRGSR
jgi:hypothetical protein